MDRTLTEGTPWKGILSFMLPIFLGLLLQQLYITADAVIVGRFVGEAALAAVGACGVLTMAFLALASGFSAGACVIIAQLFGAKRQEEMRAQASSSILLLLGIGTLAAVIGLLCGRFALEYVLSTPPSLLDTAEAYFRIYAEGMIFQFGYNIIAAVLRGIGDSKATLYFLIVASALNVALDLVFVCQLHLGVAGTAAATNIAQAASFLAGVCYMMKKYPVFRWKWRQWTFRWQLAVLTLRTGFSMALQQLIVSIGFTFIQRAVNSYGPAMTASFSVAQKVETYMILPASALMTTQSTYTGQNIGAGLPHRVLIGARQTIVVSEIISAAVLAVVFIFAHEIVALFGLGEEAAAYCTEHIRCVALCLVPFAAYFPLLGLFQGANDAFYAALVATVALAVRVLSTYALQNIPAIGYRMIWWNAVFGWGVGFVITWVHFLRGKWMPNHRASRESLILNFSQNHT